MAHHFVPYRYHTYTDTLLAVGTAALLETLYGVDAGAISIEAEPGGFRIRYPDSNVLHYGNPFFEIRDKESREVRGTVVRDKTLFGKGEEKPRWWGTVSVINKLASPDFNNKLAWQYTPEIGAQLLRNSKMRLNTGSMSQLLYAQASKGVNSAQPRTTQGNLTAGSDQMLIHLGYQQGAAGYSLDPYTLSVIPRPKRVSLRDYRMLVHEHLRGYLPRSVNDKILPTSDQTVPYFLAMAYFDFIIHLFTYAETQFDLFGGLLGRGAGAVIESLDRAVYVSMGSASAPYVIDALTIPTWLSDKSVVLNVRDVVRQTLSDKLDPNLLYLPVRAFAEGNPRHLVRFYRSINPLQDKRTLLTQNTLTYIMDKTGFADLNCDAMHRFARAIRSRTLTKLYGKGEPPDFGLLTELKSAGLDKRRLISTLSRFVGTYNLRNARQAAYGKQIDGANLHYEDLQEIAALVEKYDADFIVNTLMAQAMSKRSDAEAVPENTDDEPSL